MTPASTPSCSSLSLLNTLTQTAPVKFGARSTKILRPRRPEVECRRKIRRERRGDIDRVAGDRGGERRAAPHAGTGARARTTSGRRTGDRRRRDGRSMPCARGSDACDRVSSTRGAASSWRAAFDREVGPRLPQIVGIDRHEHAVAAVTPDRRVDRCRCARAACRRQARGTRGAASRSTISILSARCIGSFLATTSSPEVVAIEPMDDAGAPWLLAAGAALPRAWASVPCGVRERDGRRVPAACRRSGAARLRTRSRTAPPALKGRSPRSAGPRASPATTDSLAQDHGVALRSTACRRRGHARRRSTAGRGRGTPPRWPGTGRAADPLTQRRPRTRGRRSPRPHGRRHFSRRRGPSRTHKNANTPKVIEMSATLNAGHAGNLMKSVTAPFASTVDEVADGATDQQTGGQPQPRAIRPHREVDDEQHERQQREHEHDHPAAREETERHAPVADVHELHEEEHVRSEPSGSRSGRAPS